MKTGRRQAGSYLWLSRFRNDGKRDASSHCCKETRNFTTKYNKQQTWRFTDARSACSALADSHPCGPALKDMRNFMHRINEWPPAVAGKCSWESVRLRRTVFAPPNLTCDGLNTLTVR